MNECITFYFPIAFKSNCFGHGDALRMEMESNTIINSSENKKKELLNMKYHDSLEPLVKVNFPCEDSNKRQQSTTQHVLKAKLNESFFGELNEDIRQILAELL